MLSGSRFNTVACATALSLGVGALMVAAPSANAQLPGERPTLIDCDPATAPGSICANGLGASFFFPFAENIFPVVFPGEYNYGSRGSSQGVEGILLGRCNDDNQVPGGQLVPDPCSFYFSEAPLSDAEIVQYNTDIFGPFNQGLGPVVQLPVVGGLVTISTDAGAGITELTAEEVCEAFNGTPSATNPLNGLTGVRRSDGSGTSFIFTNALREQCTELSDPDGNGIGDLWSYTNANGQQVSRGSGEDPAIDTSAECQAVTPGNTIDDTTCWPAELLGGDGNDGVADVVIAGSGDRFGYVELAEASSRGTDLELPAVVNKNDGVAYAATTTNGTLALNAPGSINEFRNTAPAGQPANQCSLTANRFDPSTGFPYVGVSYGFFHGDYSPTNPPSPGANETQFDLRGSTLRNRFLRIFTDPQVTTIAQNIGYVPIDDVLNPNDLAAEAQRIFLSCVRP